MSIPSGAEKSINIGGDGFKQQYKNIKQALEQSDIVDDPRCYSSDGRTFFFTSPLQNPLVTGTYVLIKTGDGREYFAQVIEREVISQDGPEYGITISSEGKLFVASAT
jgi:hypothetical protein